MRHARPGLRRGPGTEGGRSPTGVPAPVAWRFSPPEGRRRPGDSDGHSRAAAGGRLGLLRTMRHRPCLPDRNSRRRTPRAMQGAARMRSIVRVQAWVHPVLIGRDEERRAPVHLCLVPPSGGSLPALRLRPHLLFAALQRPGAASVGTPCRAALPEQPPGPSQACRAPAALPRTPPCPAAGGSGQRAESDASPFDRRAPAS